jgi:hypothetical protein
VKRLEKIEFANGQHFAERQWKDVEGDIRIFIHIYPKKRILWAEGQNSSDHTWEVKWQERLLFYKQYPEVSREKQGMPQIFDIMFIYIMYCIG